MSKLNYSRAKWLAEMTIRYTKELYLLLQETEEKRKSISKFAQELLSSLEEAQRTCKRT